MDARNRGDRLLRFHEAFGGKGYPGKIPLPRSTAYHYMTLGLLPKPVHIGNTKNSFWLESALDAAIEKLVA